eukprot:gene10197-biopygen3778
MYQQHGFYSNVNEVNLPRRSVRTRADARVESRDLQAARENKGRESSPAARQEFRGSAEIKIRGGHREASPPPPETSGLASVGRRVVRTRADALVGQYDTSSPPPAVPPPFGVVQQLDPLEKSLEIGGGGS